MRGKPGPEFLSQQCLAAAQYFKYERRTRIALRLKQSAKMLLWLASALRNEKAKQAFYDALIEDIKRQRVKK